MDIRVFFVSALIRIVIHVYSLPSWKNQGTNFFVPALAWFFLLMAYSK